ncbi:hypothetical protein EW146_g5736 [Bondarzewia mesenterica]|uniref:Uncharacterized protein n=1 Tax=Bondarzewia mesenterica TaxID=1095465 RepID=A0A4S4LSM2_9AGAM|nr:hypothetical protein EW146_g5736 [Bondarzewia mesenterica]
MSLKRRHDSSSPSGHLIRRAKVKEDPDTDIASLVPSATASQVPSAAALTARLPPAGIFPVAYATTLSSTSPPRQLAPILPTSQSSREREGKVAESSSQKDVVNAALKTLGKTKAGFVQSHDEMDRVVFEDLADSGYPSNASFPDGMMVLKMVVCSCSELNHASSTIADMYKKHENQLVPLLQDGWRKRSFQHIRDLEILWPQQQMWMGSSSSIQNILSAANRRPRINRLEQNNIITQLAWTHDFKGNAVDALWKHIVYHWDFKVQQGKKHYTKYAAIFQSSGMGKSRLVDESSKTHLVIPMNSRASYVEGKEGKLLREAIQQLADAIYIDESLEPATFDAPLFVLAFDEAHTLTEGRVTTSRSMFYELLRFLQALSRGDNPPPFFALFLSSTGKIIQVMSDIKINESNRDILTMSSLVPPFTDLGFDQFALENPIQENWTLLDVASHEHMVTLGRPLFAARYYPQSHDMESILNEYAYITRFNEWDTVDLAAQKLISVEDRLQNFTEDQKLACLSHRLPIDFLTGTFTGIEQQKRQIESHFRVALQIDDGFRNFESATGVGRAPAAHPSWRCGQEHLESGFLCEHILREPVRIRKSSVWVCSSRRVLQAGPSVFETEEEAGGALKDAFADTQMHFNHFIKVHDRELLTRERLVFFASRGAGVLCANSQAGIDAFLPFTYRDNGRLKPENMGVILMQMKNDDYYSMAIKGEVFDAMNPYDLGLFSKESDAVVPVIRMVFAMAGKTPCLKVRPAVRPRFASPVAIVSNNGEGKVEPEDNSNSTTEGESKAKAKADAVEKPPEEDNRDRMKFVAYDIWCSGLTRHVYGPITQDSEEVWASLLHASQDWRKLYQPMYQDHVQLRQAQIPGAASDRGFFKSWVPAGMLDSRDEGEESK